MTTSNIDLHDWDLVDVAQFTNDGKSITGQAVLCDLGGNLERVNFTCLRGQSAQVFPDAHNTVSALEWLHEHGMAQLTSDAGEAMAEQRDFLRDKDTQGQLIGWVVRAS